MAEEPSLGPLPPPLDCPIAVPLSIMLSTAMAANGWCPRLAGSYKRDGSCSPEPAAADRSVVSTFVVLSTAVAADVLCPGGVDEPAAPHEHPHVILKMASSYPVVPECDPRASTALRHYEEVIRAEGKCRRCCGRWRYESTTQPCY